MIHSLKPGFALFAAAAAHLGISRPTRYELMEKLGLDKREGAELGAQEGETAAQPPAEKKVSWQQVRFAFAREPLT